MNILIINHYAGSLYHGMEFRPYYLAREWVKSGHKVTVVASSFSHLRQKNPEVNQACTEEWIDGIRYVWLRGSHYEGNGLGRVKNMLSFLSKLYIHRKEIMGQLVPHVVVASSTYPLDYYPARFIAQKTKAKLVFELHDLWPQSPMELGNMSPKHPYIRVMQKAENDWCKGVDLCVSILPNAKKHLEEHGLDGEKFVAIPNGISVSDWNKGNKKAFKYSELMDDLRSQGNFIVGYVGGHAVSNALEYFVDASSEFEGSDIVLVMVGSGAEKENLKARLQERGDINHLIMLDPIPKGDVPSFLTSCDVLYAGLRKLKFYESGIGLNKIMDYMMASKPIILGLETPDNIVSQAQCGIVIEQESTFAIVEAVQAVKALSQEERDAMGMRGKRHIEEHYDYSRLAKAFLESVS